LVGQADEEVATVATQVPPDDVFDGIRYLLEV
jgi:hypothetical protein